MCVCVCGRAPVSLCFRKEVSDGALRCYNKSRQRELRSRGSNSLQRNAIRIDVLAWEQYPDTVVKDLK